ncbi:hypothetical protein C8J56DRAFT_886893 [Mycena floridula]|nr:hypothetical protein C8J56DRAFT_886893 [Mycena floridula]
MKSGQQSLGILALPNELILQIVSLTPGATTKASLCQVCRKLFKLLHASELYRIIISKGSLAPGLCLALTSEPERATSVKDLSMTASLAVQGITTSHNLALLPSLTELVRLEFPIWAATIPGFEGWTFPHLQILKATLNCTSWAGLVGAKDSCSFLGGPGSSARAQVLRTNLDALRQKKYPTKESVTIPTRGRYVVNEDKRKPVVLSWIEWVFWADSWMTIPFSKY